MADTNTYNIKVIMDAQDNLSKELKKVSGEIDKMTQTSKKATTSIGGGFSNLASGLAGLGLTAGIMGVGKSIITLAGNLEQAKVAFTTMLGSAEASKKMLKDLSDFASKTPFELTGIRDTAKQLLAFGIDAKDMIPTLKALGDVSSGLSVDIGRVAYAYGQVKVAGRLMGQDLMQFTNAGIPMIAELSKNMGVAQSEIKKMVSEGKIGFKDVEKAFQTMSGEGGKFANMMETQSQTLQGQWSNLKDNLAKLGETIGTIFLPILKQIVSAIIPIVGAIGEWASNNKTLTTIIAGLVIGLTALASASLILTPLLGSLGISISSIIRPVTLVVAGITALYFAWKYNLGGIQEKTKEITEYLKGAFKGWKLVIDSVKGAFTGVKVDTKGINMFGEAIKKVAIIVKGQASVMLDFISTKLKQIVLIFSTIGSILSGDWAGAWNKIKLIAFSSVAFILRTLNTLGSSINRLFGKDIFRPIGEGFLNETKKLGDVANGVIKEVSRSGKFSLPVKLDVQLPTMPEPTVPISTGGGGTSKISEQKKALIDLVATMKDLGYTEQEISKTTIQSKKLNADAINKLGDSYRVLKEKVQDAFDGIGEKIKASVSNIFSIRKEIDGLNKDISNLGQEKNVSIAKEYVNQQSELIKINKQLLEEKSKESPELERIKQLTEEQIAIQKNLSSAYVGLSAQEQQVLDEKIKKEQEYQALTSIEKIRFDYQEKVSAIQSEIALKTEAMRTEQRLALELLQQKKAYEKERQNTLSISFEKQKQQYAEIGNIAMEYSRSKGGVQTTVGSNVTQTTQSIGTTATQSSKSITTDRYLALLQQATKNGITQQKLNEMLIAQGIQIQRRELGGNVFAGNPYLVGEKGPELFVPNSTGSIAPNNDLGGGGNISINISSLVIREEADINKIADSLARIIQKKKVFNYS